MINKLSILFQYKQDVKITIKINYFDYISIDIFFKLRNDRLLYLEKFFLKVLTQISAIISFKIRNN